MICTCRCASAGSSRAAAAKCWSARASPTPTKLNLSAMLRAVINGRLQQSAHRRGGPIAGVHFPDQCRRPDTRQALRHLLMGYEEPGCAAFDMRGLNDVALTLTLGALEAKGVLRRLDRLTAYGGPAYGRPDCCPTASSLPSCVVPRGMAVLCTVNLLAVAAFLLNVVLTPADSPKREQIAAPKAFGYRGREVGWHYLKLVLILVAVGRLGWGPWPVPGSATASLSSTAASTSSRCSPTGSMPRWCSWPWHQRRVGAGHPGGGAGRSACRPPRRCGPSRPHPSNPPSSKPPRLPLPALAGDADDPGAPDRAAPVKTLFSGWASPRPPVCWCSGTSWAMPSITSSKPSSPHRAAGRDRDLCGGDARIYALHEVGAPARESALLRAVPQRPRATARGHRSRQIGILGWIRRPSRRWTSADHIAPTVWIHRTGGTRLRQRHVNHRGCWRGNVDPRATRKALPAIPRRSAAPTTTPSPTRTGPPAHLPPTCAPPPRTAQPRIAAGQGSGESMLEPPTPRYCTTDYSASP